MRIRTSTRYLIGLSSTVNNTIIAWFNNQLHHTAPLSLNLLHNAILRVRLGSDHSIKVSNRPLPFRPESRGFLAVDGNDMGSQLATNISFATAFTMALYVMFYIRERSSKAKLLQLISGVNVLTFWLVSFLFDFAGHVLTSAILFLSVLFFQEEGWASFKEVIPMFLVFIIFGICTFAIIFVTSCLFSQASYGFVCLSIIFVCTGVCNCFRFTNKSKIKKSNTFLGITFVNIIQVMSVPALELSHIADGLKWIFLFFPHYALGYAFINMHQFKIINQICRLQSKHLP